MININMYEYRAILEKVVDGDTVDIWIDLGFSIRMKERLRLYGIDTAELRSRDPEEKELAYKAKDRLVELLPNEFIIRTHKDGRGKFGRILAELIVDDVNLNQLLIEEGLAKKY